MQPYSFVDNVASHIGAVILMAAIRSLVTLLPYLSIWAAAFRLSRLDYSISQYALAIFSGTD
jgi:hypothetical protein|tara:strand:+ start:126 stop:311 length:186 start_codon:yes stop_codon:yes gene_type:complete